MLKKFLYLIPISIIVIILYVYFKPDLRVKFIEEFDGKSLTSLKNNKLVHSFKKRKLSRKIPSLPNDITSISKVNNVDLIYKDDKLDLSSPILQKGQRYYISIKDFCESVGAVYNYFGDKYTIEFNNQLYTVSKENKNISSKAGTVELRGEALTNHKTEYLSVSDIEEIFSFISYWDIDNNKISFFPIDNLKIKIPKANGTISLIRLEDISVGEEYNGDNLLKFKMVAQNLYINNANFSIAWVPRFKDPENNVDIDLLKDFNMTNAAFINTLDYIINRGGIIGLHGYTHQYGNEKSIVSSELTKDHNTKEEDVINIVNLAITTADSLNIPYKFFESPHYRATEYQQSILEKYFDYIYEPYVGIWNKLPLVSPRNNTTIYVPAPLSYVKDNNVQALLDNIKSNKSSSLASFFYHPYKEFDYINIDIKDGQLNYTYSQDAPLNRILKTLDDCGYVTIKLTDIK